MRLAILDDDISRSLFRVAFFGTMDLDSLLVGFSLVETQAVKLATLHSWCN